MSADSHNRAGEARTSLTDAIAAWEAKGPTSLTVALLADAVYGAREANEGAVESLKVVRDGFTVVKALLTATREEIAAADLNGIAAVVNTGYETLDSLIWRHDGEVSA